VYSVFRFTATASMLSDLAWVFYAIVTRGCSGQIEPRARDDGYAVALCEQPPWAEHSAAVLRFVGDNRDALARARAGGATLDVDVAVEPDDVQVLPFVSLTLSEDLVDALASVAARFTISLYADAA
jgi:hypothetical protein